MKYENRSIRILALFIATVMIMTLMSSCNKKKPEDVTTTESSESVDPESSAESSSVVVGSSTTTTNATTTSKGNTTTKKSTTKSTTTISTPAPSSNGGASTASGLNNKPNAVENAQSAEDLANVAPEQAAACAYGLDVAVQQDNTLYVNPSEFTYIPHDQFATHIHSIWQNYTSTDKVKIEAAYIEEYLNTICVPLKNTFSEINCNGYGVRYGIDDTNTYAYLWVEWSYYVTKDQYNACVSKAQSICASTSGSTVEKLRAIHDYLGANITYKAGTDGPYNGLINKTCDCDGYTSAFKICMDILGVPCKAYSTTKHIFNCVQVDGKWYVIDCTFDDQSSNGYVSGQYFLIGSSRYSSYPVLTGLLSSTDYNCSRKLYISDDSTFRSKIAAAGYNSSGPYTLYDDGSFEFDNGTTGSFTIS